MAVLISGYPYVKENYFRTFDHYPEADSIFFVLPKVWKAKGGKLKFSPPKQNNVFAASAYFYHSGYSIIGGLLKGWMPAFPLILSKLRDKIDIVYSPSEPILLTTLYQAFWAKIFFKKHIIFTWENIPYENKFRGFNLLVKKIILNFNLELCDGIICGNQKAQEIFKKYTDLPTVVIPLSGVDSELYNQAPVVKDKFIYTFAGALGYRKGIHLIIDALKIVIKDVPNVHLNIVGTGEYEVSLKLKVESLKLTDRISFIPWANAEDLKKILSATDVFVYPSLSYGGWEEQFGYSMAEASLMGLPIIATKSGSIDEVVIDGETGILVEPDQSDELSKAMIRLAQDGELRTRLGQNGRNYIKNNFSYEVVARKFYEFFQKINLHR